MTHESRTRATYKYNGYIALLSCLHSLIYTRCIQRSDRATLGIVHFYLLAYQIPDSFQRSYTVSLFLTPSIVTELYAVGIGTYHRYRAQFLRIQRQQVVVILKQYCRFVGNALRQSHAFVRMDRNAIIGFLLIRVFKQAQLEFRAQYSSYRLVDILHIELTRKNLFFQSQETST